MENVSFKCGVSCSTKAFQCVLRKFPSHACFLGAGSRGGTPRVPSVDGCSAQRQGRGVGELELWKLGFLRNMSLRSTWKSAFSSSRLVRVFSAFSHGSLVLEGGKIIAWLEKILNGSQRLFGESLIVRHSSLFLSAGINVIEDRWRRTIYKIFIYCDYYFFFNFVRVKLSRKLRNNCSSILNIRNIGQIQL